MVKNAILCVLLVFGIGVLFSRTAVAAAGVFPLASKVDAVIQTILSY